MESEVTEKLHTPLFTLHTLNKEELKCTKEAVSVISMHSKVPAEDLIAVVPPAEVADVAHGFM